MALPDVILGPWRDMGDLAGATIDLQLKVYSKGLKDTEEALKRGTNASLFESAASKIAGNIGEEPDVDADIHAIASLPPAIVAQASGAGALHNAVCYKSQATFRINCPRSERRSGGYGD